MIIILLPAYNEEAPLPGLLDRLADTGEQLGDGWRIMIVNDGSSDRTAEAAMEHPLGRQGKVAVINHERNMGLARAMDTGIAAFLEKAAPGDILVAMDADDTHGPEYIPGMLEKIRGGADVVIASRFFPGGREVGVSFFRKIMSRGALLFMRTVAPVPGVSDYSCGYRAYRMEILKLAAETFDRLIVSEGFSVMTEILVRLHALGAVIREVPFTLRYDRKVGPSKIRFARTIRGYFLLRGIAREAEKTGRRVSGAGKKTEKTEQPNNQITGQPKNRVLVITATYNERENIERLVPRIFELAPGVEVLVVDDNSPDGTGEAAEEFRKQYKGLHVLRREGKLGYGTALLAGIAWARDAGFDAVVTMDADFSHDPAVLPDLIAAGREAPVVVGAR
ncbi:MAG: glycosyltransferase, partial [bacterium]